MSKHPCLFFLLLWTTGIWSQDVYIPVDSMTHYRGQIEYFNTVSVPSRNAIGGNIFIGHGLLNGQLSNSFNNPVFLGINLDFQRDQWVFQFDDYIGFGKTQKDLIFNNENTWYAQERAIHFILGLNAGYCIWDTKKIKIVPVAGIGGNILSATALNSSDLTQFEPFIGYGKLGFFVDLKSLNLLHEHIRINQEDHYYTSIRLSMGLQAPISHTAYDQFYRGGLFYFTVGMGGISRNFKTKSISPIHQS